MLRYRIFILCAIAGVLCCGAQSFIPRFPKLSEKNLPEFFNEWQQYSDSIASKNVIDDPVLANVIDYEISLIKFDAENDSLVDLPKYYVVPEKIQLDRYHIEVDTLNARANNGFPEFLLPTAEGVYASYTVTPPLPEKGLYYTENLNQPLWEFLGGTAVNGEREEIDHDNVRLVERYIPLYYGHWGGYWWCYSLPLVESIAWFDNLIIVERRTSWHTGDLIWYVKGPEGFERTGRPVSTWIE